MILCNCISWLILVMAASPHKTLCYTRRRRTSRRQWSWNVATRKIGLHVQFGSHWTGSLFHLMNNSCRWLFKNKWKINDIITLYPWPNLYALVFDPNLTIEFFLGKWGLLRDCIKFYGIVRDPEVQISDNLSTNFLKI